MGPERDEIGFHELAVFSAFAEYEHLGRAAEALGLSLPAVQRAVRSLEARLGVPLVRRDGRRIRLLHAGRILADQAARVLRTRSEAIDAVLVAAGREQHVLRIGYMYSLGLRLVPDLMADVLAHQPDVRIELVHGATDPLVDRLLSGELDAVCVAPLPTQPEITTVALATEGFLASVSANDPLARRATIDLREIRHRPFAVLREGFGTRRLMLEACARAGFAPQIAFTCDDIFTAEGIVGAGLAVSILPERMTDHENPRIARVRLREAVPTRRTLGVAFLASQRKHIALRPMIDGAHRFAAGNGAIV
jgi:LysR family transcriptional regulator, transcription activator of glutamate synthase operon